MQRIMLSEQVRLGAQAGPAARAADKPPWKHGLSHLRRHPFPSPHVAISSLCPREPFDVYSRALRCLPLPGPRCSCRPAATSLSPRPSRRIPRSRISCLARRSLSLTDTPRPAGTGVHVSRLRPCWPSLTRSNSSCARRPRPPRTSIWGRVQSSRVGPRGRNEGRWAGPSETWPSPQARRRWRGFAVSLLGDRLGRVRAIACAPADTDDPAGAGGGQAAGWAAPRRGKPLSVPASLLHHNSRGGNRRAGETAVAAAQG